MVNGVQYSPAEVELSIEEARITNVVPGFCAMFAHREPRSSTEGYCVIYASSASTLREQYDAAESVSCVPSTVVGERPTWAIPTDLAHLERSSLGKLSRTKLQARFAAGDFDSVRIKTTWPLTFLRNTPRKLPQTHAERTICDVLCDMLDLQPDLISIDQTVFELGLTSIRSLDMLPATWTR